MTTQAVSNLRSGAPVPGPGRTPGVRNRLSNQLITDLSEIWHEHGPAVLKKMALRSPNELARMAYATLPKDILHSVEHRVAPGGLSADEWALNMQVLDLIKANIPAGSNAPPAEVFEVLANALRAHFAKPISGSFLWDSKN
jgi:hypothetical protein